MFFFCDLLTSRVSCVLKQKQKNLEKEKFTIPKNKIGGIRT